VLDPIRLGFSIPQVTAFLLRRRPAAIFTTGGYVSIPTLLAATALRIPSVLWDGNVIPGRAARLVARLATAVAVTHQETADALAVRHAYVTGTPIRPVGEVDRVEARRHFGAEPADRVLLIFGGSQEVRRFNDAVLEALGELVARLRVIHMTGEAGYGPALAAREALPAAVRDRYRPHAFLRDEMILALAAADLAVVRAGASTLAEAAAFGLPLAIVPYPYAAGHQRANAVDHAARGAGVLIEDEDFGAASLLEVATLLSDPARHALMSAAAREVARPGAAAAVDDLLEAVAARRPLPEPAAIERRARGALA
jgi:UDP-N-acetylglucosamine--N-acetylmuramyl-(pentapeptide) pyrophosphoryl-undecaprenol N-acetylglucosamine transferase